MIALVFLATMINYLDQQTLSVAAPILRDKSHEQLRACRCVVRVPACLHDHEGVSAILIDRLSTRFGYARCVVDRRHAPRLCAWTRQP